MNVCAPFLLKKRVLTVEMGLIPIVSMVSGGDGVAADLAHQGDAVDDFALATATSAGRNTRSATM